jgi:hypothetical protein
LYREVANSRKYEVLERLDSDYAGPRVYKKDVRVFECGLSSGTPEAQLAVVPACVSSSPLETELVELTSSLLPLAL